VADSRLTGSEKRVLAAWVLVGVAGALFAHKYFFRAFPEASVDFKVSRTEAVGRARQFLSSVGQDVSGYQSAIVFDVDDNAKTYLEREVGLQQANRLMSSELNIWYWDARFFKPGQEEEFYVRVSPAGQIVGYNHKIEEQKGGGSPEQAEAEKDAQDFLSGKMGVDLSQWKFLPEEANSSSKPNRVDWSFTWEKRDFRAKDAPYRLRATLHGKEPGDAEEFLQVPEAWQRSYEHLRSTNNFLNTLAIIPYLLLMASAVWLGITFTRQGQTSWGPAIRLGIVVAILLTFMQLNTWPQDRMSYDTNTSYGTFVFEQIGAAILFGLASALTVVLPIPGGEPLYRFAQPAQLRLRKAFTLRGLRSKEFFKSATIGLSMAAGHIGFIVAFYIVARHFGAWAPQDVDYENSVNTTFPWIAGVAIGLLAATSEEFLFRLFAIPFLKRLTGSSVVAVIVPAFCWSFLHAGYPNEPPYIRGLEVGLIGIVAGIVMLKWGILATLIWHYTVDASLVGLLLVRSNSLYFKISGVAVGLAALAPLIFAGVWYMARGRFEEDADLLNSAEPIEKIQFEPVVEREATAPATTRRYEALAPGMIMFLMVCVVLGGIAVWKLKVPAIGDYLKLSVDARGAKARADAVLRQHGADPKSFKTATIFMDITDPYVNEFLRERVGIKRLNEIYERQVPGAIWQVRYFRPGDVEEYSIKLGPDGGFLAFNHNVAEDAAGASLSKEEAQAKAAQYLTEVKKLDLSRWTLVEADSDKRQHRTDHELSWQENGPLDGVGGEDAALESGTPGHAYARVKVAVLGDEVVDYRDSYYAKPEAREEAEGRDGAVLWSFVKIPDEWRRQRESQSLVRTLYGVGVPILLFGGLGITALAVFLKNVRSAAMREIPWKRLTFWGGLALIGFVLIFCFGSRIQESLNIYPTAIPFKTMVGTLAIGTLLGAVFYAGGIVLVTGVAAYFCSRAFGVERLPVGERMPALYYRDALIVALGGTAGFLGVRRGIEALAHYWVTVHRSLGAGFGQGFDATLPAGMVVGSALVGGLYVAGLILLIAAFMAAVIKARWLRLAFFVLGALYLAGGDWGNGGDFAKQFVAEAILLAVMVFGMMQILRFNVLGTILVIGCMTLVGAGGQLLAQPEAFYRLNGYVVVAVVLAALAYPLVRWRMEASESAAR
jgi:membrane protease YdiL (CAAX protease family)